MCESPQDRPPPPPRRRDELPRVLIVSPHAFAAEGGGSLTISSLFANWPRSRLASIWSLPEVQADPDLCPTSYRLYPRISANPREWPRRVVDYLTGRSESLDGITSIRMTRSLRRWIDGFSPELVYSHLGPLWMTRLTNRIVADRDIPLVVHVMDDYVTDWPVVGRPNRDVFVVARLLNRMNKRAFTTALDRATMRYVISPVMATEYERRYGYEFSVAHRGIDPDRWTLPASTHRIDGEVFRIYYGGSIAENKNLRSLQDVAASVIGLASEGFAVRMEIACFHADQRLRSLLEAPPHVVFVPTVRNEDMPARLAESDLLILPFDFTAGAVNYFRYSWPTKLAECMMSGVPILLYGPPEAGFVQHARSESWAHVVVDRDVAQLTTRLREIARDSEVRMRHVQTARAIAASRHNIREIRKRFEEAVRHVTAQ